MSRLTAPSLRSMLPTGPIKVAACWIVVTKNGQYVYSTNAGSGSLSGFSANSAGNLSLLNPDGRTGVTGDGSAPIDAAMNNNSHYLYALLSGTHGIAQFAINSDGSLISLGILTGLNPSMAGLAAR